MSLFANPTQINPWDILTPMKSDDSDPAAAAVAAGKGGSASAGGATKGIDLGSIISSLAGLIL